MKRDKVDSSIIYSIGFDREKGVLEVEFVDGAIYQYTGVPRREYIGLLDSGSRGKYFLRYIKDLYPSTMINKGEDRSILY